MVHHDPLRSSGSRRRLTYELNGIRNPGGQSSAPRRGLVTLLYSSHDEDHNNAVALQEYLQAKSRKLSAVLAISRNGSATACIDPDLASACGDYPANSAIPPRLPAASGCCAAARATPSTGGTHNLWPLCVTMGGATPNWLLDGVRGLACRAAPRCHRNTVTWPR